MFAALSSSGHVERLLGIRSSWIHSVFVTALSDSEARHIGGSRPIAFSGYPRGHIVNQETQGARSTLSANALRDTHPRTQASERTEKPSPEINPAKDGPPPNA